MQLGFSFVIAWRGGSRGSVKVVENIHEMVQAAARAQDAGFDYILDKLFLERQEDGSEVMDPAKSEQELQAVIARIQQALVSSARTRHAAAGLPGARQHQPARADGRQLARLHAAAEGLPHADAAPGA